MDLKINNYKPNFNARMELSGNIKLLNNEQVEALKYSIDNIGTKNDVIDINLPSLREHLPIVKVVSNINNRLVEFSNKCFSADEALVKTMMSLEDISIQLECYGTVFKPVLRPAKEYTKEENLEIFKKETDKKKKEVSDDRDFEYEL